MISILTCCLIKIMLFNFDFLLDFVVIGGDTLYDIYLLKFNEIELVA